MNEKQLLKKNIIYYFKQNKYKLTILYLVTIISNLLSLIPLYLFGTSLDFILSKDFDLVIKTVIYIIIIFFITTSLSVIETILHNYVTQAITLDIKKNIYTKILKLKRIDFNKINNGEFITKIENDSLYLANFITEDMITIVIDIVTVIITVFFTVKLSFPLAMISFATFPITILITSVLSKKTRKYILIGKNLKDKYFSKIQETLTGIEEIKCLNIEKKLIKKYNENLNEIMKNSIKIVSITTGINTISSFITSIGEWSIILVAARMIINNTLTIGILVSFNSFCNKFTSSIENLAKFKISIQEVYLALNRIDELISLSDESEFKTNLCPELTGSVFMDNVCFSYDKRNNILKDVNLKISAKSLYVIVGKNGCGKTSLLNLILRFYETSSGKISFDNSNIKDMDITYLRKNICYVPQQPFIFSDTIENNLAFDSKISLESKINVCKLVGLHSFINKLPNKYNSIIGKEGIKLSGGQKQKLSIARGILKNPRIMILDEITSDLDSKSELEIMELLNYLSKKFTIITVAHRINSIITCPNIIVMKNGKIIGQGNHNTLIKNCSEYINLYEKQLKSISSII